jgi:hypothetical protein
MDFSEAHCEICNTKYNISYELKRRCELSRSFEKITQNLLMVPLFLVLLAMLIMIITLLS